MSNVDEPKNPLVALIFSRLRDKTTSPKIFRELVREISALPTTKFHRIWKL